VYSGFAIAHAAGQFLSTSAPMSVSGQSRASNGIATLFNRGRSAVSDEFFALNAKDGLHSEPTVPDLAVFPHVPVADSFAFAKRALFPELPVEMDRKALAAACVAGARVTEADWPAALAAIRASLADTPDLQTWFDAELARAPYSSPVPVRLRPERLGIDRTALHLDAAAFGVSDVAGAAALCERLLGYRKYGLALRPEEQTTASYSELQRQHAACLELHALVKEQDARLRALEGELLAAYEQNVVLHSRGLAGTLWLAAKRAARRVLRRRPAA
jgi:hypothetical protein